VRRLGGCVCVCVCVCVQAAREAVLELSALIVAVREEVNGSPVDKRPNLLSIRIHSPIHTALYP